MEQQQTATSWSDAGVIDLKSYLTVLWRWKVLVIVVTVALTAGSFLYAHSRPSRYEATAQIAYEQRLDVSNLSGGAYSDALNQALEVQSVATVAVSRDVAAIAAQNLGKDAGAMGYTVTAEAQEPSGRNAYPSTATITASGGDAQTAADVANAYALGFISWRKQRQSDQVERAKQVVKDKMGAYSTVSEQHSSSYLILEQQWRDLQVLEGTITGDFTVVSPAQAPARPVSPRPLRSAALGFVVGLVFGTVLALLLEAVAGRVRDPRAVAAELRLPLVGRLPRLGSDAVGAGHVAVLQQPDGPGAEAVRQLRGALKYFTVEDSVRSLFITSAAQGEGKSVALANLAVSFALAGKSVVVVDADLRRPRMDTYFALPPSAGLTGVLTGTVDLGEALMPVELPGSALEGRLHVLPSGPLPPNPGELVDTERFAALIDELETRSDLVLVDAPALLPVSDAVSVAAAVDAALVLVDMSQVRARPLRDLGDALTRLKCRVLGVLTVREKKSSRYDYGYHRYEGDARPTLPAPAVPDDSSA